MRLVTKTILAVLLVVFSITAAGVYLIYTSAPEPKTEQPITPQPSSGNSTRSSFEDTMDNWTATGTDLTDPPVLWWINRTHAQAYDGTHSLQLTLDNLNDQGKIWIERQFTVTPSTIYHVTVSYAFGTTDYGMNLFHIITAVTPRPPAKEELTTQDETGNGLDNATLVWLPKTYEFITTSSTDGILTASIGIWGTNETSRTYYLDAVNVTIQPIPPSHTLPNLDGVWTITTHDFTRDTTQTTNATLTQNNTLITLAFDDGTTTQALLTPNVLTQTQMSTGFILSGADIHGQHPFIYILSDTAMEALTTNGRIDFMKIKGP